MKKNLTGIIGIAIIILIAGVVIAISKSGNPENKKANLVDDFSGNLTTEESVFDFGAISMAAGDVSHLFRVKNASAAPVKIAKIYTSCMCTTATYVKGDKKMGPFGMPGHGVQPKINQIVEPGAEAQIEVVFDPAAHGPAGVGKIERAVYLEGESSLLLQLGFSAVVTP